jgi:tetratricopeptide (TPR) repeat protein
VDPTRTIDFLNFLGVAMFLRSDFQAARGHFEEVELLAREAGDIFRLSVAISNLGEILLYEGKYEQARLRYAESAALARDLGLHESLAAALGNEGFATLQLGDPGRAANLFGQSVEAARVAGDIRCVIAAATGLAAVLADRRDPATAIALLLGAKTVAGLRGFQFEPFEQQVQDRTLEKLRAALSEDEFQLRSEAAARTTEDDLIEEAAAVAAGAQV